VTDRLEKVQLSTGVTKLQAFDLNQADSISSLILRIRLRQKIEGVVRSEQNQLMLVAKVLNQSSNADSVASPLACHAVEDLRHGELKLGMTDAETKPGRETTNVGTLPHPAPNATMKQ
jgi:hypothetical protein